MTVKYGFFNSSNGDRVYDAEDFSRFFDGIIFDGVYSAVGNRFNVEAAGGMLVTVDTGRAWFDHTWTFNDQKFALMISDADTVYSRIDAVVIEVNKDQRKNFIKVIQGTPAATPQRPSMSRSDTVTQYALAYVTVPANASSISTENIAYVVDTSETPLCSALNLAGLPSGGTIGQVLAKKSASSGDVGWYNVSALPYSKWYLANGVTESNVLAAFRFVNRLNETQALAQVNEQYLVTGSAISLTKSGSPTWNTSTGFHVPWKSYLDNATLRASSVLSIVIRLTDISTTAGNWDGWAQRSALPLIGNCISGRKMTIWASMPFTTDSHYYLNTPTLSTSGANGAANVGSLKTTGSYYTSGTIGYSKTDDLLYRNGTQLSRSKITSSSSPNNHDPSNFCAENVAKLIGGYADTSSSSSSWDNLANFHWGGSFRVQYLALYNVNLSAAQHSAIYNQIEADILS